MSDYGLLLDLQLRPAPSFILPTGEERRRLENDTSLVPSTCSECGDTMTVPARMLALVRLCQGCALPY